MLRIFSLLFLLASSTTLLAQNTRISDYHNAGWYGLNATFGLSKKISVQTEYQWRRVQWGGEWEQSLLRGGINYKLGSNTTFQLGGVWTKTYPYGEYTLNSFGKVFPEYRIQEQITVQQRIGRLDLSHRYRLEQRWIGKFATAESTSPESYTYMNRFRYMLRAQMPIQGPTLDDHEFYAAASDELFIGLGKNVQENIFDQNRLYVMAGYQFSKHFRLEGGYFQQVLQFTREVKGSNVFQYNNGIAVNAIINVQLRKY